VRVEVDEGGPTPLAPLPNREGGAP
jgi:hypothetical protein